jgi:hypothetical protein
LERLRGHATVTAFVIVQSDDSEAGFVARLVDRITLVR